MLEALRGWTKAEKNAVAASYLGWTLDAFDFFLLTFVITDIAREFGVGCEIRNRSGDFLRSHFVRWVRSFLVGSPTAMGAVPC